MIVAHKLINKHNNSVEIINYGARIGSLILNTNDGPKNVSLSYHHLEDYINDQYFLGATVGRYANRLKLDNGDIILHGGEKGFHSQYWNILEKSDSHIVLEYISNDGEEGFLGTMNVKAYFLWSDANVLDIKYTATTDTKTIVNLTSHPYFNLDGCGTVDHHKIKIFADKMTITDDQLIPTGEITTVESSKLDYRRERRIGQTEVDHNFILSSNNDVKHTATVLSQDDQICLDIYTNQPGVQFYTGHYLESPFGSRAGFCLEAQNFPDAPNHAHFPSAELLSNEIYKNQIRYDFKIKA